MFHRIVFLFCDIERSRTEVWLAVPQHMWLETSLFIGFVLVFYPWLVLVTNSLLLAVNFSFVFDLLTWLRYSWNRENLTLLVGKSYCLIEFLCPSDSVYSRGYSSVRILLPSGTPRHIVDSYTICKIRDGLPNLGQRWTEARVLGRTTYEHWLLMTKKTRQSSSAASFSIFLVLVSPEIVPDVSCAKNWLLNVLSLPHFHCLTKCR